MATNDLALIDHRYRMIRPLGKGMSGMVYLVEQNGMQSALKFLNTVQFNVRPEDALRNFKNEFSILKELTHPHINDIVDFGYDSDKRKYYFTTEFIEGMELHKACEGRSIDVVEKLLLQILRALNYLHSRGIYHFDIKPQNVLVRLQSGQPVSAKLIDFGLAGYQAKGRKIGSPAYMSPEAVRGGVLDSRADLYSFGVMAYFLLTGTNPFLAKNLQETLDRQLHALAKPASSVNSKVPKYWDAILARLLEKDPDLRYSQASLVLRDLSFFSGKRIVVETEDTRLGYLPERGALIGRDAEWEKAMEIFGDVFLVESSQAVRLIVVHGDKGSGKTRFVSEIKTHAQLKGVATLDYKDLLIRDNLPERFLLVIDESYVTQNEVNAVMQRYSDKRCLILWATEAPVQHWIGCDVVELKNYSEEQLRHYLESVTGIMRTPDGVIRELHSRTQGNPFLVAEFVKALLRQNLLFDESGKWDAETFEDFAPDFSRIVVPKTIEESLRLKLLSLTQEERSALAWLAVNGAPLKLDSLAAISDHDPVPLIESCVRNGLAEFLADHSVTVKNPFFAELLLGSLSRSERKKRHAMLACWHLQQCSDARLILYHQGYSGEDAPASEALRKLASLYLDEGDVSKALPIYRELKRRENSGKASMELSRVLMTLRHYEESAGEVERVLQGETVGDDLETLLEAHALRIEIEFKKCDHGNLERALDGVRELLNRAGQLVSHSNNARSWQVLFKNHEAYLQFKKGHHQEALKIYEESYRVWRDDLNESERCNVGNNRIVEVLSAQKEFERALQTGLEFVSLLEKNPDRYPLALQCYMLANVYYQIFMSQKRSDAVQLEDRCLFYFERAVKISREIKNLPLLLRAYNGVGIVSFHRGNAQSALEYYQRALNVARKINEMEMAGFLSYNIATLYKDGGNIRDALSFIIYAINTFKSLEKLSGYNEFILYHSYLVLADVQLGLEDLKETTLAVAQAESLMDRSEMAKGHASRLALLKARLSFLNGEFDIGNEWLNQARALATTPEQKDPVGKYLGSLEYKKVLRKMSDAAQTSGITTTANISMQSSAYDALLAMIDDGDKSFVSLEERQRWMLMSDYLRELEEGLSGDRAEKVRKLIGKIEKIMSLPQSSAQSP